MIAAIIFWACVFLILHSYLFYPFLLKLFAGNKKLPDAHLTDPVPTVSVLMSVYNEEKVIEKKIRSVFKTNYPADKIELVIGSDGSVDQTDAIIQKFISEGFNIQFKQFGGRNGKSNILNQIAPLAKGEIFILTDANILFEENTIPNLVRYFSDPMIGLVGANIINSGMSDEGISFQEEAYIKRENIIKYREGLIWGTMMGAFGACYAIRKEYFVQIPPNFLMEDFFITMGVIKNKKHSISDLDAKAYEDVSNLVQEEFKRKVRISAGNFQNLFYYKALLLNPFSGAGFSFWSHKVLRWVSPFLLIISFFTLLVLQFQNLFYTLLLFLHIFLMLTPFTDWLLKRMGLHNFAIRLAAYFYIMNLALLIGFIKYIRGIKTNAWSPTQRNIQA